MTAHPMNPAARPPGASAWPGTAADVPGTASPSSPAHLRGGGEAQTPRTWAITIPPGTVLRTSNDRLHPMEAARINKSLRFLAQRLAAWEGIPHVERADILLTYLPPPRLKRDRHPLASARVEDAGALYPTAKALIDGITDAGVFTDDNFRHVRREIYQLLDGTDPRGRLKLHIIEVAP